MNKTTPYKLYWTQTGSTNAATSVRINRSGEIAAIGISLTGVAGAGVNGFQQIELSRLAIGNFTMNDTPPSVLADTCIDYSISGAATNFCQVILAARMPVNAGDMLYIHQNLVNTAPASCAHSIFVYVAEGPGGGNAGFARRQGPPVARGA